MYTQLLASRHVTKTLEDTFSERALNTAYNFRFHSAKLPLEHHRRNKHLRQLLITAVLGGVFIARPQIARAAEHPVSGSQTNPVTITEDDVSVVTSDTDPFSVTASSGDALTISGSGNISYIDTDSASLIATGTALSIASTGDNGATPGSVTVNTDGTISGGHTGINVLNYSSGATSITTTGDVTGTANAGISANNFFGTTDLTIHANNVIGGITATNSGSGTTQITATGDVEGATGIYVDTFGDATSLTIQANNITGDWGINAKNGGAGFTDITTSGDVTGTGGFGIYALNYSNATSLTIDAKNVTGNSDGIYVENSGSGATSITTTTTGDVEGITGIGINVTNDASATDLIIKANNVQGGNYGIHATNQGSGVTSITTTGDVKGTNYEGIYVINHTTTTGLTIEANNVEGNIQGINVSNQGSGDTSVTAGNVTGTTSNGIYVFNNNTANDLTINVKDIKGSSDGVLTTNMGNGATNITTRDVTATNGNGIDAANGATTTDLIINVNNVTSGYSGIFASNYGSGVTGISTSGEVKGFNNAIEVNAAGATSLTINDNSSVHNSSGSSSASAISITGVSGQTSDILNNGIIQGNILTGAENNTFTNNFLWDNIGGNSNFGDGTDTFTNNMVWDSTGGTTDFGADDDVFNNKGTFWAAGPSFTSVTNVSGIESVNNSGVIAMQNSQVGDETTFTNGGSGIFHVNGGLLTVDTDIATAQSDVLHVDNATTDSNGPTGVVVNVMNGLGLPTSGDGIEVVDVSGDSSHDAFVLNTPLNSGVYSYGLRQGVEDTQSWFIQSDIRNEAVVVGVLPILGSRTALSTLSNLHDRQRDVKVLSDSQDSGKGVWGRIIGQGNNFNANEFGFDTNLWGAQAGIDLMASSDGTDNRKYAGLYVSYASASGDALHHGDKVGSVDLDATTLGAYYTKYSSEGWYLDAVAQYSWLCGIKAKTTTDEIKPGGSSYALSLEAGRQFNPESSILREVQAQLIYQNTSIDDVTLVDDTSLNISGLSAVTGRFGLRLYQNPQIGKKFLPWVRANLWHTFSKDSTYSSLGTSISTPIGGTSGELQAGFTMAPGEGGSWNLYASAGYLFDLGGAEYSGWKGTLGVRKGW